MTHRAPGECDFQIYANSQGRISAQCKHCNQVWAHGVVVGMLNKFSKIRLENDALKRTLRFMKEALISLEEHDLVERAYAVYRGTDDGID